MIVFHDGCTAAGLNPNHVFREWGMGSALHAASHGGHLPVVHLLLQAGANTDVLDRDQNTPLMLACANSHNQVVKYLVKAGASVTFKVRNVCIQSSFTLYIRITYPYRPAISKALQDKT